MAAPDDVAARVRRIIAQRLAVDPSRVTPDASFLHDLGADSLDCAELPLALEDEFGITIPMPDWEGIATVQQVVDYISQHSPR